jgi:hypothetical protein
VIRRIRAWLRARHLAAQQRRAEQEWALVVDDEDDWSWPPAPPEPPTEREGLRVGDEVTLVTYSGAQYPVRVIAFTAVMPCNMVVEWLGLRPLSGLTADNRNTICLRDIREVRRDAH